MELKKKEKKKVKNERCNFEPFASRIVNPVLFFFFSLDD